MTMATTQCLYASKPCDNPRSLKDNGQLHRLCTFHRIKANDAQRRWHSRQRTPAAESETPATATTTTDKPATKKRRRTARTDSSDDSSESDVANVPARPRRRRKHEEIARPRALLQPLATDFTALLVAAAPPQVCFDAPADYHKNELSDYELAQLGDFILELEETSFQDSFVQESVEREWWTLPPMLSIESGVYCL